MRKFMGAAVGLAPMVLFAVVLLVLYYTEHITWFWLIMAALVVYWIIVAAFDARQDKQRQKQ